MLAMQFGTGPHFHGRGKMNFGFLLFPGGGGIEGVPLNSRKELFSRHFSAPKTPRDMFPCHAFIYRSV